MSHVKKETGHKNIYLLDRGLQSARNMKKFSDNKITFICRSKENKKHIELESFITENLDCDLGESTLIKDSMVQLYTRVMVDNKSKPGEKYHRQESLETNFRLIIIETKTNGNQFWLLTNDFNTEHVFNVVQFIGLLSNYYGIIQIFVWTKIIRCLV